MTFCDGLDTIIRFDQPSLGWPEADDRLFNISRLRWPDWSGWVLVDEFRKRYLNRQDDLVGHLYSDESLRFCLREFYLDKYWIPLTHLALFDRITTKLFDLAVVLDLKTAIVILQQSINELFPSMLFEENGNPNVELLNLLYKLTNKNNGEQELLEIICEKQKRWFIKCTQTGHGDELTIAVNLERSAYIPF